MTIFLTPAEATIMLNDLNVANDRTRDLLAVAQAKGANITRCVQNYNLLNQNPLLVNGEASYRRTIVENHIFTLCRIQREIGDSMRALIEWKESIGKQKDYFENNQSGYGQMHKHSKDDDIAIAETTLHQWIEKAKERNINVEKWKTVIAKAKEQTEINEPGERSSFQDFVARLSYVHYLNLFSNKIILRIAKNMIQQEADKLRSTIPEKKGLINVEERVILKKLNEPRLGFYSPYCMEQHAITIFNGALERMQKVIAYKMPKSTTPKPVEEPSTPKRRRVQRDS